MTSPDSIKTMDTRTLDVVAVVRSGRVLVAGAGVSGRGAISMLQDLSCPEIVVVDDNASKGPELASEFGIEWVTTASAAALLNDGTAAVVTSPGWPPHARLFVDAASNGVPVFGDVAVAYAGDRAGVWGDPRTWLVVTGTNGKTTTTSMLAEMLGSRGEAVGNIGVALHDALRKDERVEVLAAELSSFQLHWAPNLAPDSGALLNLAEDHIDWHGSFDNYCSDKARALTGNVAVFYADDPTVITHVEKLRDAGHLAPTTVSFTDSAPEPGQVGVRDGFIVDRAFAVGTDGAVAGSSDGIVIAPTEGISPPGKAGVLDAVAATALARSAGVSATEIKEALSRFQVRAHRGQVVCEANDIRWIDDSKATNPHAADAALSGHDSVVWVAGGQLKGAEITPLVKTHAHRFHHAIVLGTDRAEVVSALESVRPELTVTTIDSSDPVLAMKLACSTAAAVAKPGDVVLLAPAAASLDMYSGMAERGDLFARFAKEVTS